MAKVMTPTLSLTIMSTSPGVSAKFSNDGRQNSRVKEEVMSLLDLSMMITQTMLVKSFVRSITIAGKNGGKRENISGEETHTINVGSKDTTEVVGKGASRVSGNSVKMREMVMVMTSTQPLVLSVQLSMQNSPQMVRELSTRDLV